MKNHHHGDDLINRVETGSALRTLKSDKETNRIFNKTNRWLKTRATQRVTDGHSICPIKQNVSIVIGGAHHTTLASH